MPSRPFTVSSPVASISRRTDGRFSKVVAPTPGQFEPEYGAAKGNVHRETMRAVAVPMTEVSPAPPTDVGGNGNAPAPIYKPSLPWPAASTGPLPFRNLR